MVYKDEYTGQGCNIKFQCSSLTNTLFRVRVTASALTARLATVAAFARSNKFRAFVIVAAQTFSGLASSTISGPSTRLPALCNCPLRFLALSFNTFQALALAQVAIDVRATPALYPYNIATLASPTLETICTVATPPARVSALRTRIHRGC